MMNDSSFRFPVFSTTEFPVKSNRSKRFLVVGAVVVIGSASSLVACSSAEQERVGSPAGSGSQITTDEDEKSDQPVPVSGAFLWQCDYADGGAENETDATIGCNLNDNSKRVDISGLSPRAVLLDASGAEKGEMTRGSDSDEWHYEAKVKHADLGSWKTKLVTKDAAGQESPYESPLKPLAGTLMLEVEAARTLAAASLDQAPIKGKTLSAASFCTAAGVRSSIEFNPASLVPVPLGAAESADFSDPSAAPCFKPLREYVDGTKGKLLKVDELVSRYVGAGPTGASGPACFFAMLSGGDSGADRLVLVQASSVGAGKSIRRTAYFNRCK